MLGEKLYCIYLPYLIKIRSLPIKTCVVNVTMGVKHRCSFKYRLWDTTAGLSFAGSLKLVWMLKLVIFF